MLCQKFQMFSARYLMKDLVPRFFLSFFTSPVITPGSALCLSLLLTSLHASFLLDFGFSQSSLQNFLAWHFTHRSYGHGLTNFVTLIILLGSGISISFAELLLMSMFVFFASVFDPIPFYGASGIIFMMIGKLVNPSRIFSSYRWLGVFLDVPVILPVLLAVTYFMTSSSLEKSVEYLHLFSFFCGATLSSTSRQDPNLSLRYENDYT